MVSVVSGQPISSKWWCSGELRNTLRPVVRNDATSAWDWTPAPTPHIVERFGHFGARDDDQPVPNCVA